MGPDAFLARAVRGRRPRRTPSHALRALDAASGRETSLTLAALAALALVVRDRRRGAVPSRHALLVLASVFGTHAAHRLVRRLIDRPRPLVARLAGKRSPSFPSGHAARAAALFGALANVAAAERAVDARAAQAAAILAALVAGTARVARGRHWPTDIVGGVALGALVAAGCAMALDSADVPVR